MVPISNGPSNNFKFKTTSYSDYCVAPTHNRSGVECNRNSFVDRTHHVESNHCKTNTRKTATATTTTTTTFHANTTWATIGKPLQSQRPLKTISAVKKNQATCLSHCSPHPGRLYRAGGTEYLDATMPAQ